MSWLIAIALALAALAVAVAAFRVPKSGWTTIAAALALGLAGYALQASPDVPGAPTAHSATPAEAAWALVDERKGMVAENSGSPKLITADAYARRGLYADAAAILRGALADNPRDGEVWLALGNALVEHSGGVLTEPALFAYRRAAEIDGDGVGPGYFLGLALIRQGQLGQAAGLWRSTLDAAAPDAPGRELLALRLGRLETLLAQPGGPVVPN